jgi:hypothetical protein
MQLFMLYFLQHFNVFNPTSVVKQPYNVAPPSCKFVYNPHELSIVISIINHSYCWAFQCFANQGLHVLPARHWLRARDVTALICLRRSPFFEGQPRNVLGWWMNKSKFLCSMGWIRLYQLFCWICWAYVSHLFWACTVSVCIPHDLTNSSGEMLQWWHPGVTWLQCSCCTFHPTRHLLPPQEKSEQPSSPAALHGAVGPCHPCPKVGLCNLLNTPSVTHVATLALVVISISPDRDVWCLPLWILSNKC